LWGGHNQERPIQVTRAMLLRIVQYFRPYWPQTLIMLGTVAAIAALGLVPPLLMQALIDNALPNGDMTLLVAIVIGMVAGPTLGGLLSVVQNYFSAQISQHVMFDLRNELYRHVQSLSLKFFTSVKTGEVMSRLNNDVSGVSRVVGDTIIENVMQVFILVSTVFLMVRMDLRLALLALVIVPLELLPARRVGNRRYQLQRETQRTQADLTSIMQETLNVSGFVLMKSFGRELFEQGRFRDKNGELMDVQIRSTMLGRWFRMMLQVFGALGPAIIFLVGGYFVITGEMTLGTIVAFVALLSRLYGPISQLVNVHVEVMGSLALFERIFEYLDIKPDIADAPRAHSLPTPVRGSVVLRDVSFGYVPGRLALDNVSFEARPGELVALVGPSGAGKTTITYLIPRFYDVLGGSVAIDGHDVRDVTLESIRSQMGVVTQETYLFNATVRDNLRYAKPDATDDELIAACRAARLDDVIARMPDGLDTNVGERGYRMSGGEKQRLAIARVLLKDPRILILDEATSSLDSQTEADIQAALGPLMEGRTTLAIAHRLSTVLAADRLVVLDQGRLVESGTHRELIERGGLYSQLYEIQFKPQLSGTTAFGHVIEPAALAPSNGH
jgi:ATP-binding cassette subfamily B protein